MTSTATPVISIRPLQDADVEAAAELSHEALAAVGREFGFDMGQWDETHRRRSCSRIRHLARTDPDGSVVAERDGEVVGIGLALRRDALWFLSLLAVRMGVQGGGIGRRLLDATLEYGEGCAAAMICASPDPKALRRYGRAGFAVHAGYEATGRPDRRELPAGLGVRDGDWDRDREFVDALIRDRRGAGYGPDFDWCEEWGFRLFIRDGSSPADRAVVIARDGLVGTLAAASDDAAARVLWATIAEASDEATAGYLLNNQQWAIAVALAARLTLRPTDAVCTRGAITPPDWYLPSGLFG